MVSVTTRPYEINMALSAPVSPTLIKTFEMSRDTAIFGICLAFVYAISLLIVTAITRASAPPSQKQAKMDTFTPFLLATPFWGGVLLCSTDLLPIPRLSFLESIYWSIVAWSVIVSAFAIFAALIGMARLPYQILEEDEEAELYAYEPKTADEEELLTLQEALATTSPPPSPVFELAEPSPRTSISVEPVSRPRLGSVTRCWSDAKGAN